MHVENQVDDDDAKSTRRRTSCMSALVVALVCATDVACAQNALKLAKRAASEEHSCIAAVDEQQVARAGIVMVLVV